MDSPAFRPSRPWYWNVVLLFSYGALAVLAKTWTESWSGWFVLGVAPVLLLDKLIFRLLSPPTEENRSAQLAIRLGYMALGAIGILVISRGAITGRETFFLAVVLTLVTFVFEFLLEWVLFLTAARGGRLASPYHPLRIAGIASVLLLPLLLLHPLIAVHPLRRTPANTPASVPLAYEEASVLTHDGVLLTGWVVPAEKPLGTVIYCHGYGENREQVLPLLPPLNRARMNVVALDFRGHGHSQGHTATFGHREAADVEAAYRLAKARYPEQPVMIVGVSYGAAVAVQALPHLHDVRGAWLDSSFGRLSDVLERNFAFAPALLRPALLKVSQTLVWIDCGFWSGDINPIDQLERLKLPIYFCHGTTDVMTLDEGKAMYDAYDGPKEHYWVQQQGPYLTEVEKQEYYRRMQRFLIACAQPTKNARPAAEGAAAASGGKTTFATSATNALQPQATPPASSNSRPVRAQPVRSRPANGMDLRRYEAASGGCSAFQSGQFAGSTGAPRR